MATTTSFTGAVQATPKATINPRQIVVFMVCAGLPLGLFGLVNLGADALGLFPFFFAPFGLPGWMGGAMHLFQLLLLGMTMGVIYQGEFGRAHAWLAGFSAVYIALPFITPPLDSMQLTIVCSMIFLLGLATMRRVGQQSAIAGWLMTPTLAIVGFSATMGLMLTAAYTPPFALVQGQNPAPGAA